MRPRRSALLWGTDALALLALAFIFAMAVRDWGMLPDRVPSHFNASGHPDDWSSKGIVWLLPVLALGTFLLLTWVARFQGTLNVPFAIDRNSPAVRQVVLEMVTVMKASTLLMLAYLQFAMVATALGRVAGLGALFLPLSLAMMFLPAIVYLRKLWKLRSVSIQR